MAISEFTCCELLDCKPWNARPCNKIIVSYKRHSAATVFSGVPSNAKTAFEQVPVLAPGWNVGTYLDNHPNWKVKVMVKSFNRSLVDESNKLFLAEIQLDRCLHFFRRCAIMVDGYHFPTGMIIQTCFFNHLVKSLWHLAGSMSEGKNEESPGQSDQQFLRQLANIWA